MIGKPLAVQASTAVIWKTIQLAGTKLIFLVRTLVLAAILFPEDFGLLSISLVALDFLMSITNLGLSQALIQKEIKNEKVLDTIWTIGFLRGLLLTGALYFSSDFIGVLFDEPRVAGILQVLAFKPLIDELSSVKVAHLMKELNFKSLALIKIAESAVSALIAIIFASTLGIWALILGIIAGSFTHLITSYIFAPYNPRFELAVSSIKSFISFGMWIFMIGIIAVSSNAIVQIIITRNLGTTALGLYYLAGKIAFLAYEVSSEVIGSVAFSVYSKVQTDFEKVYSAWNIIIRGVSLIYFPILCLLIGLAPYFIDYVLGQKWAGTEKLIQLLSLSGIFLIFADTAIPILKGLGRPDKIMLIELGQYIILVISIYFLSKYFGITGAASGYIFAGISSLTLSIISLRQIKIKLPRGNSTFFLIIIISSVIGTIVSILIVKIFPGLIGFICAVISGAGVIVMILWFSNSKFNLCLPELIDKAFPRLRINFSIGINKLWQKTY